MDVKGARGVPCSSCGARAGDPCRSGGTGAALRKHHPSREERARRQDPETSHQAARQAHELASEHHAAILAALELHGPGTKDDLAERTGLDAVAVARRMGELETAGRVVGAGTATLPSGRRGTVLALPSDGADGRDRHPSAEDDELDAQLAALAYSEPAPAPPTDHVRMPCANAPVFPPAPEKKAAATPSGPVSETLEPETPRAASSFAPSSERAKEEHASDFASRDEARRQAVEDARAAAPRTSQRNETSWQAHEAPRDGLVSLYGPEPGQSWQRRCRGPLLERAGEELEPGPWRDHEPLPAGSWRLVRSALPSWGVPQYRLELTATVGQSSSACEWNPWEDRLAVDDDRAHGDAVWAMRERSGQSVRVCGPCSGLARWKGCERVGAGKPRTGA